jgi:hypothetical protein
MGHNVEHRLLKVPSLLIDLVPLRDTLFSEGGGTETGCARRCAPIPEGVVPSSQGPSDTALASVMSPSVEVGAAKTTVRTSVFAAVTFPAHRKQQAIPQGDTEVPVWHRLDPIRGR